MLRPFPFGVGVILAGVVIIYIFFAVNHKFFRNLSRFPASPRTIPFYYTLLLFQSNCSNMHFDVRFTTSLNMQASIPHAMLRKKRRSHSTNPAIPHLPPSNPSNPMGMSMASASRDSFANSFSSRNGNDGSNNVGAPLFARASTGRSNLSYLVSCGAPPSYSFSQATFAHDLCSQDRLRSVLSTQVLFSFHVFHSLSLLPCTHIPFTDFFQVQTQVPGNKSRSTTYSTA